MSISNALEALSIAVKTERAVGRRLVVAFRPSDLALAATFLVTAFRGVALVAVLVVADFFAFVDLAADSFLLAALLFVALDVALAFFLSAVALLAADFAVARGFLELTALAGFFVAFAAVFADFGFLDAFSFDFDVGLEAFALEGFLTFVLAALDFFFWLFDRFFEPPTVETSGFVSGSLDAFCESACSVI